MSLGIYRELSAGVYSLMKDYSVSDGRLPITTVHDGTLGEVVEMKLFLRNNDANFYYEDITILPVSKDAYNDVIGTATGHGVKLSSGAVQPTESEWDAKSYGVALSMSDIGAFGAGDTSTYAPLWYRNECPAGAPVANKENVVLRVSYTETHT